MPLRHQGAVIEEVADLADRFVAGDRRLYLVGGIVRDLWLDLELSSDSDIDLTTDATPAETKQLVADLADAIWTQGERFGTIGLRRGGRTFEITTHRSESYISDSRKPIVSFGTDVGVDLSRRDFTVNAMAVEVPSGKLIDPWGGARDLAAGRLATPLSPEISFTDDPLRMLRAARFGTKYNLDPVADLVEAATQLRERLRIVAIERIGDEIERLLSLASPGPGLGLLVETGLAEVLFTWGSDPGSKLGEAAGTRLVTSAALVAEIAGSWQTRLAGWLLAVFDDPAQVDRVAVRLRLSSQDRRTVRSIAAAARVPLAEIVEEAGHTAATRTGGSPPAPVAGQTPAATETREPAWPTPPLVRRWAIETAEADAALEVASALAADPQSAAQVDRFHSAYLELTRTEPLELDLLDGAAIMAELGIEPGPTVGEATQVLREAWMAEGPLDHDAQRARLAMWWSDRDAGT